MDNNKVIQVLLESKEPTPITPRKLHNIWVFFLFVGFSVSFYAFLLSRRFYYHPLPYQWGILLTKIATTSVLTVLCCFLTVLYFSHIVPFLIFVYGGVDLVFLFYSSTNYERVCCVLSFVYYAYCLLEIKKVEDETRMILREACVVVWNGFGSSLLLVSGMTLGLVGMSLVFMNLRVYCIIDRAILYTLYCTSLYVYISLCIFSLKIYIFNYVTLTCNNKNRRVYDSMLNTFYSLGKTTLLVVRNLLNVDKPFLVFYSTQVVAFISCVREIVISTSTSYTLYLLGIHNLPLSQAQAQGTPFRLTVSSQRIKSQIYFFLVLIGFVFMNITNFFYAQIFRDSLTLPNLYQEIKNSLVLDVYSTNIFTFFVVVFSLTFFFSMFMMLISSSVLSLLILFKESPEILRKSNNKVHCLLTHSEGQEERESV